MFQVKVADKYEFNITENGAEKAVNGKPVHWEVEATGANTFSIYFEQTHYTAEVKAFDKRTKQVTVKIDNNIYTLAIKDQFDLLLEKMGMNHGAGAAMNELKSPMPGLVLEVMVAPGQSVKKGDPLLILEAMKMENVLKSPGDGTVTAVHVTPGAAVEKNALLVAFD